jgi:hypothetical protein
MIEQFKWDAPVAGEADVLVCGGGPSGTAAAIVSARSGLKTVLVEQFGNLGGAGINSLVGVWLGSWSRDGKYPVIGGLYRELEKRLVEDGGGTAAADDVPSASPHVGFAPWHGRATSFEYEPCKRILEQTALEAGVELRYFTTVVQPKVKGDRIEGVFVHSKNGLEYIRAKAVVDATGDADVTARSGCKVLTGLEDEGKKGWFPASSLFPVFEDVDTEELERYCTETGDFRFIEKIKDIESREPWPFYNKIFIACTLPQKGRVFINSPMGIANLNGLDVKELTDGMITGRKHAAELEKMVKKHMPGFGKARLVQTAPVIGVRTSRRIVGEYKATVEEARTGKHYDDVIALTGYHWDMHAPDGSGPFSQRMLHKVEMVKPYIEVPYSVMVPKGLDNLIAPGRAVSVEWDVMGPIRIMPCCFAMGEAAGMAAGSVQKEGSSFRSVNVQKLQESLLRNGAILEPKGA